MVTAPTSGGGKQPDKAQNMHDPNLGITITPSPAATDIKDGGTKAIAINRLGSEKNSQLAVGPNHVTSSHGDRSPIQTLSIQQISLQPTSGFINKELLPHQLIGNETLIPRPA